LGKKQINKIGISISLTLFLLALTQKSYCTSNNCADSLLNFLLGWIGALMDGGQIVEYILETIGGNNPTFNTKIGASISWIANPLIFTSMIFLNKKTKLALILSTLSLVLILSFLFFDSVLATEAGHYFKIKKLKFGYWLWFSSSITIVITAYLNLKSKNNLQQHL
jgi:uncharacterized membrane protein